MSLALRRLRRLPAIAQDTRDAYDAVILAEPNLVAYWRMDGTTTDLKGSHTLTKVGNPGLTTFVNGSPAYVFDGASQHVYTPTATDLSAAANGTGRITVELWGRADITNFPHAEGTGPYVHFMGKLGPGVDEYAGRMYNLASYRPQRRSGYAFQPTGGKGAGSYAEEPVSAGTWWHYAFVCNAADLSTQFPTGYTRMGLNGIYRDQDSLLGYNVVPTYGNAPLRFGSGDGVSSFFLGSICKAAVYKGELGGDRLWAHYTTIYPSAAGSAQFFRHVGHTSTAVSGTKLEVTVTEVIPAGATLVCRVFHTYTSGGPTIGDVAGNTYTRHLSHASGTSFRESFFLCQVQSQLEPGMIIQASLSDAVAGSAFSVDAFTNMTFSSPLDTTNTGSGTSATPKTGTGATPTQADHVSFGINTLSGSSLSEVYTEDPSYTGLTRVATTGGTIDLVSNAAYHIANNLTNAKYQPTNDTSHPWLCIDANVKAGIPTITPPAVGSGQLIRELGHTSDQVSGTSLTITLTDDDVSTGHVVGVFVGCDHTTGAISVTDTKSNTYSTVRVASDSTSAIRGAVLKADVGTKLVAGDQITVTWASAITNRNITVAEFAGATIPSTVDQSNGASGNSTGPTTNITPTVNNTLILGLVVCQRPTSDTFYADITHQMTPLTRVGTNSGSGDLTLIPSWRGHPTGSGVAQIYAPALTTAGKWVDLIADIPCT